MMEKDKKFEVIIQGDSEEVPLFEGLLPGEVSDYQIVKIAFLKANKNNETEVLILGSEITKNKETKKPKQMILRLDQSELEYFLKMYQEAYLRFHHEKQAFHLKELFHLQTPIQTPPEDSL